MKFFSPEVDQYFYKSIICSCMKYCCHGWAGAPSCYLNLLEKLQKQICRTVGPSLAASIEPMAHRQNVASFKSLLQVLLWQMFFRTDSTGFFSQGRSTHYFDILHDFSVTIPRYYKDVYMNSFFPHTGRLWNSLPIVCFALTYDLSCFKTRINRHLLTVGSF